ncbi:DUF3139 domain-containing protein [Alkalicoccus daliensis]|uniref:DUF3139 domain-containing protein n=1 Tax=Alkalicoccus daliensis TaxID=745820 RepID=A0A1H0GYJ1_9BACI|nr:DUF3139 domain-containing protein [Alkalicoccus daliensis]SDO11882.1 Protein of unknown function [Alkalicoccus daliensis]
MKKSAFIYLFLLTVLIAYFSLNAITLGSEQHLDHLETKTLSYLSEEKGYKEYQIAVVKRGYENRTSFNKDYYVKIAFHDEPLIWYKYTFGAEQKVYQSDSSAEGKHTE